MTTDTTHMEGAVLERLLSGELTEVEREALQHHLAGAPCDRCDEALDGVDEVRLDAAMSRLLARRLDSFGPTDDGDRADAGFDAALGHRRRGRWRPLVGAGSALLAAGIAALVLLPGDPAPESPAPAGVRAKGTVTPSATGGLRDLRVLERGPDGAWAPVAEGGTLSPGDVVVFEVHASAPTAVALLEETGDGCGVLLPEATDPVPLAAGGADVLRVGGETFAYEVSAGPRSRSFAAVPLRAPPGGAVVPPTGCGDTMLDRGAAVRRTVTVEPGTGAVR